MLESGVSRVTTENLDSYRELARAGVMYLVPAFVSGEEANFRFTDVGRAMRIDYSGERRFLLTEGPQLAHQSRR